MTTITHFASLKGYWILTFNYQHVNILNWSTKTRNPIQALKISDIHITHYISYGKNFKGVLSPL